MEDPTGAYFTVFSSRIMDFCGQLFHVRKPLGGSRLSFCVHFKHFKRYLRIHDPPHYNDFFLGGNTSQYINGLKHNIFQNILLYLYEAIYYAILYKIW